MITETADSLFLTKMRTILCPCNAAGAMGAGVAKSVRTYYPVAFHEYRQLFPRVENPAALDRRLAETMVNVRLTRRNVLLFCTKYHWTEKSPVELIDRNLAALARDWDILQIETLAMPLIGCGKGGLNYERDVRPLIVKHLSNFTVEICGVDMR